MPGLDMADRSFWVTQGVARTLGLNLTGALADGRLDQRSYRQLVSRCDVCGLLEDCAAWMSQQQGIGATAPAFCPNKPILDRLAELG